MQLLCGAALRSAPGEMSMLNQWLKVEIDFKTSHQVFPHLIEGILLVLAMAIVVTHKRSIVSAFGQFRTKVHPRHWQFDRPRLLGCLLLTVVYFLAMEPVGSLLPNTGLGFWLCSCVFGLLLSRLFVHDIDRRKRMLMLSTSLIMPTLIWFVFAQIFRVTLP